MKASIDPLLNDSMMTLAKDMTPAEHDALVAAKDNALKSLQFEEKLMSERLAELRSLIEELKKK